MASHKANAQHKSIDANPSIKKDRNKKKNTQVVLHQAKEQRLSKGNRPNSDLVNGNLMATLQAGEQTSEEEDGVFVTTTMMRVVLSGIQKDKKKGQRILSFVALVGACAVVGIYLIIPIMICLRITDPILAILIAALILTLIEGIVGMILVRIGSSHQLTLSRQPRASSHISAFMQPSSALIPMPSPPPVKSSRLPTFLPAAPAVGVPARNRVAMIGKPAMPTMPVTDPLRLADVAQIETIQINGSRTAIVPPLLKLPASS